MEHAVSVHEMRRILWQWGNTLAYIARKREEQSAFRAWADDAASMLKAQQLTGMPRGGSQTDIADMLDELDRRRAMYQDAADRVTQDIDKRLRLKAAIDERMGSLTEIQRRVLTLRYEDGRQWQYIALKLCYAERSVRRMEEEAVRKMSAFVRVTVL